MTYLPDLRESLVRAAHRQRELRTQAPIHNHQPLRRWHRARSWSRAALGGGSVLLAVGVAVAVAVTALVILGRGKAPSSAPAGARPSKLAAGAPQQPNISPAAWTYIKQAQRSAAAQDPSCSAFVKNLPATSAGQPSTALTSILGVLRRPATPADQLPEIFAHGGAFPPGSIREIYINDVRLARTLAGTSFYIIPAGNVTGFRPLPNRCTHLEVIALQTELQHAPATKRARLLDLQRTYLAWEQYQARHPEGICFAATARSGSGSLGCGNTIADIEQGRAGLGGATTGTANTLFHGVVPDGVATVTLRYPPSADAAQAVTITSKVINNLFVVSTPGEFPQTITWRAANGSVINHEP
jgi:hypothetical protein